MSPLKNKQIKLILNVFLLFVVTVILFNMANSIYYMYYFKQTVAFITDIDKQNKFTLFLPNDRYAITLVSTDQNFKAQKPISGKIFFNGIQLSTFSFYGSDGNAGENIIMADLSSPPHTQPWPHTHDIAGYYYLRTIGDFHVENRNSCTLEIVFEYVPDNILLKIETYLRK